MEDDRLIKKPDEDAMKIDDSKGSVQNRSCSPESVKELEFSEDEETLIIRMYNLVGERWGLIAGRIPGRSAEEIEKFWKSRQQPITHEQADNNKPQNSILQVAKSSLHDVEE